MRKALLLLILPLLFSFKDTNPVSETTIPEKDKNELTEGKAYKMLYENQIKANDGILKTIFYALGGLGTAVLLVFGSNWWFNDKKVKEAMSEIDSKIAGVKKDALNEFTEKISFLTSENITEMNQTQVKLQEEVTLSISTLTEKFNDFIDKTRTEIKEDSRINISNYQDLIKSYNDNLTQQINSLKESAEEKVKQLDLKIELNKKNHDNKLSAESKRLKRDLLSQNAQIAFLKGNFNIALKAFLDQSLFEFENNHNSSFKYTSSGIIKCLEKVTFIYDDEELALNKLVELSKDEEAGITDNIIQLYKSKEVKKLH
ncbi:hypothetical protein [Flavobacterium sp. MDT1-60]|uniref:hypothetical protein n=1 Tax=Flavobacterium sp. MDT1-60 TaxID=1979344 RepID=UPI00177F76E1|nr:hypothetical protein [Flavobacterium sp. MDT1-60]QOG03468.1 hypothetical protein IHE43_04280 [Flavobacterium sp. MDT1-60]